MSNNYNIKLNQKQPSSEDIAQHQDFDALLAQHQRLDHKKHKTANVRTLRLVYLSSAAAAIALLVFFVGRSLSSYPDVVDTDYFAALPYVTPPLPEVTAAAVPPSTQRLDASKGGVIEYESGSKLYVPSAAFQNDRGQAIVGEVDIVYREYHDFVDFFFAGIPMYYDSASMRYAMEAASMVEIYALHNGQRVQLAPGKTLDVELVSSLNLPSLGLPEGYQVYYLDQAQRSWRYHDIDRISVLEEEILDEEDPLYPMKKDLVSEIASIEATSSQTIAAIEAGVPLPVRPAKPQRRSSQNPTIELDFTDSDLKVEGNMGEQYKGTIWEVSPKTPAYDPRAFQVVWEESRLRQLSEWEYELTLTNRTNTLRLIVNPVLSSNDFEKAMAKYDAAVAKYQSDMAAREAQLASTKAAALALKESRLAAAQQRYETRLAALQSQGLERNHSQQVLRRKVVNRFSADKLGFWNCTRLHSDKARTLKGRFTDEEGNSLDAAVGYLYDKQRDVLLQFPATNGGEVHFDDQSENLLWMVTKTGKLAVFSSKKFKAIPGDATRYTFRLRYYDAPVKDEAMVRQLLEL